MTDPNDSVGKIGQHPIIAIVLYLFAFGYAWPLGKFLEAVVALFDLSSVAHMALLPFAVLVVPILASPMLICVITANNLWSIPDAWVES